MDIAQLTMTINELRVSYGSDRQEVLDLSSIQAESDARSVLQSSIRPTCPTENTVSLKVLYLLITLILY